MLEEFPKWQKTVDSVHLCRVSLTGPAILNTTLGAKHLSPAKQLRFSGDVGISSNTEHSSSTKWTLASAKQYGLSGPPEEKPPEENPWEPWRRER